MIISVKIDTAKIDKTKLYKGAKGTYLDITLLENREGVPDQYGNSFMVVQDIGKEARERGEKGAILGNGKIRGGKSATPHPPSSEPRYAEQPKATDVAEDVPW